MRSLQTSLIQASRSDFGGSLLKSNAKVKRPLHTKDSIHLVLKSKVAIGKHSLLSPKHILEVERIVRSQAKACGVKIYHFVNVGNHLHLVILIKNRVLYARFIRAITGLIARLVTGRERAHAQAPESNRLNSRSKKPKFWQSLPFSRVITWGREFKAIANYMNKNRKESLQIQKYIKLSLDKALLTARSDKYRDLARLFSNQKTNQRALGFDFYSTYTVTT
jgi:REP element-mobilizing transposase RayT